MEPKIANYNSKYVIRVSDIISLDTVVQGSFKGEAGAAGVGQYKTWSPLVKMRLIFGRVWQWPCEAEAHTQVAVKRIKKYPATLQQHR